MISWFKKDSSEPAGAASGEKRAVDLYRETLAAVREHALGESGAMGHRQALFQIERVLQESPVLAKLEDAAARVREELADYGRRLQARLSEAGREQQDVVDALGRIQARIVAQGETVTGTVEHVAGSLEQAALSPELEALRAAVQGQAGALRDCVARMQSEQQAALQELETQVAEYKQRLQSVHNAATTDELTEIANRRGAEELLTRLATENASYTLLVADLDKFKSINDTWGHSAGDQVLRIFAKRLAQCFRPGDLVARWGGDEFVVILPGAPLAAGLERARHLKATLAGKYPVILAGRERQVTVGASAGAAERSPGEAWHVVFERADQALYDDKARRAA